MLARLHSASVRGLDAEPVDVEVDLSRGLPAWNMVGLPDAAVREAKDRVRSALLNSNFEFPLRHITVNLAPADRKKDGSYFDLPVAIGLLMASRQLRVASSDAMPFMFGELALDGRLNPVSGILPLVLFAQARGFTSVILPAANAIEAAVVEGIDVLAAASLLDVVAHLSGAITLQAYQAASHDGERVSSELPDMADIRGQPQARRALEVAAAGGHHLLMSGPPGVGKSMLAARLPSILPPLSMQERLQVARIYSVSGEPREATSSAPPFRNPHHSASDVALIGGGSTPRPGEVSKASYGVLFLDELPEYKRQVLEVLRQPLESGSVCIARAAETLEFPARFQLVAAMNPCPCGYLGHPTQPCRCSSVQVRRYQGRISGPLLDRFDLYINIPSVEKEELTRMQASESSAHIAKRVQRARQVQYERQGDGVSNSHLQTTQLEMYAKPDTKGMKLLETAMSRLSLSARSYHRILKVALTISDLAEAQNVTAEHIAEALQYRIDMHNDAP